MPPGHSGSSFLRHLVVDAIAAFPSVFADVKVPPGSKMFKKRYRDVLSRFEAARTNAPERAEIARFLARACHDAMVFAPEGDPGAAIPLQQHIAEPPATLAPLVTRALKGPIGLFPEVPFDGRTYRGAELLTLGDEMAGRHLLNAAAHKGLSWIANHVVSAGGTLDLRGRKFAILGAGAELAPTEALLRAGATVLWVDVADPDKSLGRRVKLDHLAGEIVTCADARDLLTQPREIAAAIRQFADGAPVDIGLFAYAPGKGREIRISTAMNAIVRALDQAIVKSVSLYISPTTPAVVQAEELEGAAALKARNPAWRKALERVRALNGPGHHKVGNSTVARSVVSLQGPGYQAAQYIAKVAAGETYAVFGLDWDVAAKDGKPVTVSANIAGITNTRSLEHPLFQAGFLMAPRFSMHIFEAATTRTLNGLLMLRDVLDPEGPGAAAFNAKTSQEKAAAALSQQVHGGIYAMPWDLEATIRVAAVLGMARKPKFLFKTITG